MSDSTGAAAPEHFREYVLDRPTLGLWTLRQVLASVVAACGISFFLGLLPLVGLLEERAFGYLGPVVRGFDHVSRVWLALLAFGGLALAAVWTLVIGLANVSFHRHVARTWADPSARVVPVAWQRQVLVKDPLNGVDLLGLWMLVAGWFMAVIGLIAVGVMAFDDGDSETVITGLLITGAMVAVGLLGGVIRGRVRRRGHAGLASAPWRWDQEAMVAATSGATAAADRQTEEPLTGADRVRLHASRWARRAAAAAGGILLVSLVVVFVRKPGRHADERSYGPAGEQAIDVSWQILLALLAAVAAAVLVGLLATLAYDAWRVAGLAARLRRQEVQQSRPPEQVLKGLLETSPLAERVGMGLVAVASWAGTIALSALWTDPEVWGVRPASVGLSLAAEDVYSVARIVLAACAVAIVLGAASIVLGLTVETRWRGRARRAWPLVSSLPTPPSQVPGQHDLGVATLV